MKNLTSRILGLLIGSVITWAALKALASGWRKATGEEPPSSGDPDTPVRKALTWAALSGVAAAIAQILSARVGRLVGKTPAKP
ncbi:MAG: DUF4235 domain-containing protein [Propionibacteriaceae bacterium]|nr:DUF4235 domain-containing protein [Propionibacteriaceae bacterium]